MATINNIEHLINSNTNVVFTFGDVGSGKTTLLITLYEYLFKNVGVELNSKGNRDGVTYLMDCAGDLRYNKKLPPPTSTKTIKEVDWMFKFKNQKIDQKVAFTFLDMAGEDLNNVNFRRNTRNNKGNVGGTLDLDITKYLECDDLSIILLCIIDYEKASEDNELNHIFINYIKDFNHSISGAAIIVTKWDKNPDRNPDISKFINTNAFATLEAIRDLNIEPYIFPFSIGEVDSGKQEVVALDLSYCKEILEFLHSIAINTLINNEEEYDEKILDFIGYGYNKISSFFK